MTASFLCTLLKMKDHIELALITSFIFWGTHFFYFIIASQDSCRSLKFTSSIGGRALMGHVIKNISLPVSMRRSCRGQCVIDNNCVSFNIGPSKNDQISCQLSDSDHVGHPGDLKPRDGFTYTGTENPCSSNPCLFNGTCLSGLTQKRYLCVCQAGDWGENCEKPLRSCKEFYDQNRANGNKAYPLIVGSKVLPVYCHMTDDLGTCGGGGWTLVIKIDGNKTTFDYHSHYWTDKNESNIPGGETGFDAQETKLPTFWNSSFSKICLGMKIDQKLRFIVINKQASSLHSLIADGQYRNTSLGRDTWKSLIGPQASLQSNCNKEGFNVVGESSSTSKARIGMVANNEEDCITCDSRIGFGTTGFPNDDIKCGNAAPREFEADNDEVNITAMGYILVH